jgi:hypothetical protein
LRKQSDSVRKMQPLGRWELEKQDGDGIEAYFQALRPLSIART